MKLYELINEHEFPKIKTHDRWKVPDLYDYEGEDAYVDDDDLQPDYNPATNDPKVKTLGTGVFATAYQHKDTPYDVTKGSKATRTPDGWQALFTALSKDEKAQSNPYFPRFRSINKFKGNPNDKGVPRQSYVVKVETLEPYKNLSGKEREMLVNKLFDEHGEDVINHYWEEDTRDRHHPRGRPEIAAGEKLAWAIRACLEGDEGWEDELRWTIEDKKFLQAIEFLQKASKEYDYNLDLHRENIMIRRTSVGVQLVLNDPLGFSSSERPEDKALADAGHPDWE